MDLKNRIPCAIMNQGKSMLIDKTSILSQNLGHYLFLPSYYPDMMYQGYYKNLNLHLLRLEKETPVFYRSVRRREFFHHSWTKSSRGPSHDYRRGIPVTQKLRSILAHLFLFIDLPIFTGLSC